MHFQGVGKNCRPTVVFCCWVNQSPTSCLKTTTIVRILLKFTRLGMNIVWWVCANKQIIFLVVYLKKKKKQMKKPFRIWTCSARAPHSYIEASRQSLWRTVAYILDHTPVRVWWSHRRGICARWQQLGVGSFLLKKNKQTNKTMLWHCILVKHTHTHPLEYFTITKEVISQDLRRSFYFFFFKTIFLRCFEGLFRNDVFFNSFGTGPSLL